MRKCADDSTPRGTSSEFRRGTFHQIPPHPTDSLRRVPRNAVDAVRGLGVGGVGGIRLGDMKLCCQGHWVQCAARTPTRCDFTNAHWVSRFPLSTVFPLQSLTVTTLATGKTSHWRGVIIVVR